MRRWTRSAVAITSLLAMGVLASCDSDGTSTTSTSSTSSAATTAGLSTSTSTTSTTSTTPPTTNTSTTVAPSTSDVSQSTKQAVADAVKQSRVAYNYALTNYDAPDALDVLAQSFVRDSPSWNLTLQNMQTLRSKGWLARPNPDVADTSTVEGEVQLLDGPPATKAQATVCTISAGVIYKPGAAPDGSDLIVNDEVVARRELVTMVLQDGAWKAEEGTNLGTWNGRSDCPAA